MVWVPTLPGHISRASLATSTCLVVSAHPDGLAPAAGHWSWKPGENHGVVVLRAGTAMTPGHGQALCCPCPSPPSLWLGFVSISILAVFAVTRSSPPRAGALVAGHSAHGECSSSDRAGSRRQGVTSYKQRPRRTVRCRSLIWEASPGTGSSEVWCARKRGHRLTKGHY